MKSIKVLQAAVFAALVIGSTSTTFGRDVMPSKVRTSGTVSKTYIANPSLVPPGTPFVLLDISGVGHGTGLGKCTVQMGGSAWIEFIDGVPFAVSHGPWTVTAANGDQLFGTYRNYQSLLQDPNQPKAFTGTSEILGGTGRFVGATGLETLAGTLTALSPTKTRSTTSMTAG